MSESSQKSASSAVIIALDYPNLNQALALIDKLDPSLCRLKVGKEMFTYLGPSLVTTLHQRGFDVFLDLKFHDIPNTVARAVTAAAELGVWMLNVHAVGGAKMMQAAREALLPFGTVAPKLIAVTVLTSMDCACIEDIGINLTPADWAQNLAALSLRCGLDGVVCSAREAAGFKQRFGPDFLLVTPGIRPSGSCIDDQQRVMTPKAAQQAGVDFMVIGRPITQATDPARALSEIIQSLKENV